MTAHRELSRPKDGRRLSAETRFQVQDESWNHLKEITSEWITVDEGKPTTKIQFRMEDGRKLIQKFNHDHTMSDLFLFVGAQDNFDVPFMVSAFSHAIQITVFIA